jgi:RimJ/RimL family protein N-acetyltransferase
MAQAVPKERLCRLADGTALQLRPIRPDDEALYAEFFRHVTPEDIRLRFFAPVKEFNHASLARFTQLDPARAMAFVAIDQARGQLLGVARVHRLPPDAEGRGEFAVLVRSDQKGHGLGWLLMQHLIDYARDAGLSVLEGEVLAENVQMLKMCAELGFHVGSHPGDPHLRLATLTLHGGV